MGHFPLNKLEQAKSWAATIEADAGRIVVLDDFPDDVVAIRAEGTITRDDYEHTLIPVLEACIETHGKIKLLYWIGKEFTGFSIGAIFDDAWFGAKHIGDFSKIAVVSDVDWLRNSVKLFAPLIPAEVKIFPNADIEASKKWIVSDLPLSQSV